jgi:hypothetical protein
MTSVPSELWALAFSFAFDPEVDLIPNRWMELSSTIRAGWEDFWLNSEETVRGLTRTEGLLSWRRTTPRVNEFRSLLAVAAAPVEMRERVVELGDNTLSPAPNGGVLSAPDRFKVGEILWVALHGLVNLRRIGYRFGVGLVVTSPVDLRHCTSLREIGLGFLQSARGVAKDAGAPDTAAIEGKKLRPSTSAAFAVYLPPSLEKIGAKFLIDTTLEPLDLRQCTRLEEIPNQFLFKSRVKSLRLPPNIKKIGSDVCRAVNGLELLDLQADTQRLTSIGDQFLFESDARVVHLPASLKEIGSGFLSGSLVSAIDIAHTTIEELPNEFLSKTSIQRLELPPTVSIIGTRVLSRTGLQSLDLSGMTWLRLIGDEFLSDSSIQEIRLPTSLRKIGSEFLKDAKLTAPLDLGHTMLEDISTWFLHEGCVGDITLPPTLLRIANNFLHCVHGLKSLDLSTVTGVGTLADGFLYLSPVQHVLLPSSLTTIGIDVFRQTALTELDLSGTQVTSIGGCFCLDTPLTKLSLPSTLKSLGRVFLRGTTIRELDLSRCESLSLLDASTFQTSSAEMVWLPPRRVNVSGKLPKHVILTRKPEHALAVAPKPKDAKRSS